MRWRARVGLAALGLLTALAGCDKEEEDDWEPITFGNQGRATSKPARKPTRPTEPRATTRPAPPPPPRQPTLPAVNDDPINRHSSSFSRRRAKKVLAELVAALPSTQRAQLRNVPLAFDATPGLVNAFAGCSRARGAFMAITDGIMEVQAQMARAKANDEVFGTNKFDAYVQLLARKARPKRRLPRPPRSFYDRSQDTDGRKVKRQHELFDEQLAWVLGHELAHHYLSHTGCIGNDASDLTPADFGRALKRKIPAFNQPNEAAADLYGTQNALNAGKARSGHKWSENGAMLTLRFFLALRQRSGSGELFTFEMTHPHPNIRMPVVQQAADSWRSSGGASLPVIPLPTLR
jgi:hypothetical protein